MSRSYTYGGVNAVSSSPKMNQTLGLTCPSEKHGYSEGESLKLRVNDVQDAFTLGTELNAKIAKVYKPSTASVIMEVDILTTQNTSFRAVLKLYDRRFCPQLRQDLHLQPYTGPLQVAYLEYIRTGDASKYLSRLCNELDSDTERSLDEHPMAHFLAEEEVFLQDYCLGLYEKELSTYKRLQNLQGTEIPQLLTSVTYLPCTPEGGGEDIPPVFTEVKGILIELISGFPLAELADNAPRESWQMICNQAVRIVHQLSDHDILNEDTAVENVIVSPCGNNAEGNAYRLVMLDFAECRFRQEDDSDEEWVHEINSWPHDIAIGAVMQEKLENAAGFHLDFQASERFFQWESSKEEEEFELAKAAATEARLIALELGSYDGTTPFIFYFKPNITVTLPPLRPVG